MSNWKKNVLPAVCVIGAVGSFVVGNEARTRIDTGQALKAIPQSYLAGIESNFEAPRKVPEGEMFYQLLLLLERDYVDPNIDEKKLAYGAVRGMIGGLWDPLSIFYKPAEFADQERRLEGEYRGAGVEVREICDPAVLAKVRRGSRPSDPLMLLPTLEIAMVAPGSPAEAAGLQVGDRVMAVNGRYLLGYPDIAQVRSMQKAMAQGKLSVAEFGKIRAEFQKKAKSPLSVGRAREILTTGEGREIRVEWQRQSQSMQATLTTAPTKLQPLREIGVGTYRLQVCKGASDAVRDLPASGVLTFDLRNSGLGNPGEIKPLLEALAPEGRFGVIVTDKPGQPVSLVTTRGTSSARNYRLLVDKSTRGSAEILALALKSKGHAELVGGPTAGEAAWVETHKLPDGSGYALNTGLFRPDTVEAKK